jgi:hypothetical protein
MIQATDLRIGNWLSFCNMIEPQRYVQVTGRFLAPFNQDDNTVNDYYQPIPLTSDILEKCGFEEVEGNEYYGFFDLEGIRVHIHKRDGSAFISYNYATIDAYTNNFHLHQLQNLYKALTNNELTINL